uniref:Uncharacterized protein n=1 Tax=Panagrolaimus sp. PS1159 TaxID=55785 RepID=A0AC35G5B5_9BILA
MTSRTGKTQWSCDGNAITQISICSSFGMDAPRHRIYEAPPSSRQDSFYRPSSDSGPPSSSGSLYYVKQKLDSRFTPFVNDFPNNNNEMGEERKNGQRCFDGGQIGKFCYISFCCKK